eukprot:82285_1
MNDAMLEQISNKLSCLEDTELKKMNSYQIAELICNFLTDKIETEFIDKCYYMDGKWFTKGDPTTKFVNKLFDILSIHEDDANQIYDFIKRYDVPSHEKIKNDIHDSITLCNIDKLSNDDIFCIDFAKLCIKLKNNEEISAEAEQILNVFYHLLTKDKTDQKPNYDLINKLYKAFSNVFSKILHNWWCSQCCYNNRSVQLNGKYLQPNDFLMKNCIVCGCSKIDSICNQLKNKTQQNYLKNKKIEMINNLDCNGQISGCGYSQALLKFLQKYPHRKSLNYPAMLKRLSRQDVLKNIFVNALKSISASKEKQILMQQYYVEDADQNQRKQNVLFPIDGKTLCEMTTTEFNAIISPKNNNQIMIQSLYNFMYDECNKYISHKQIEEFGASYFGVMQYWKHVLQTHFNANDCKENIYKCTDDECNDCKKKVAMCNNQNCMPKTRQKKRRRDMITTISQNNNSHYNAYIKQEIRNDELFQTELDNVHINILHKLHQKICVPEVAKNNDNDDDKEEEILIEAKPTEEEIEDEHLNRYNTDLGLYGFGMNYDYCHLQPSKQSGCLKHEVLNTEWVTNEIWDRELNKAFKKTRIIIESPDYRSKQYNRSYGISRGQPMSTHQILAICLYTDISKLCTDYRSTFRRVDGDKNEESTRIRHCKYYFFSRFIYEAIEFFGSVMNDKDTVYHGLNQPFLFDEFLTHFNAPTSTTVDKISAQNFASDGGIILELKNGNTDIDVNPIISQYESNQPRYLDVSWISDFGHERELLFFGKLIIFKIQDIIHKEIQKNTLKQLNLLQEIIENKQVNFDKIPKRVNTLCQKLIKTREMNLESLSSTNKTVQVEEKKEDTNESVIECMSEKEFIEFSENILINEETQQAHKWKSSTNAKTKAINAFMQYCTINQINGRLFSEISRKLMANWMKIKHNVIPGDALKIHTILKKEIIEMKQTEKSNKKPIIEDYTIPYHLQLFQHFTICRGDFICLNSIFNMPQNLKNALLVKDNITKKK